MPSNIQILSVYRSRDKIWYICCSHLRWLILYLHLFFWGVGGLYLHDDFIKMIFANVFYCCMILQYSILSTIDMIFSWVYTAESAGMFLATVVYIMWLFKMLTKTLIYFSNFCVVCIVQAAKMFSVKIDKDILQPKWSILVL